MTLAIMQPYILPYFGYFQLINVVDKFVLYNDVQFIKQGWINRNRLVINKEPQFFTVPLIKISSNKMINETHINHAQTSIWLKKLSKSITQAYGRANNIDAGLDIIKCMQDDIDSFKTVDQLNKFLIEKICDYLEISTAIIDSSELTTSNRSSGQERVIEICKTLSAKRYINAIGGKDLYDKNTFLSEGINLGFIENTLNEENYKYSILHTIMVEDIEIIRKKLNSFNVI